MIVYQDEHVLVIDKPSGLSAQGGRDDLMSRLKPKFPYVGLHHRLDRPASGLLVLTLSRAANAPLARAMRGHEIRRQYQVVLTGVAAVATWTSPLDGKTAQTDVAVCGTGDGLTAARVSLHTGRTHQIRRHAALAGVPVAGDRRYGGDVARRWPRLALHAFRLGFAHPITGADLDLRSPLPDDLAPLWAAAGGPDAMD